MSKLVVNTIEAQTYKYDSDTTGMTLSSNGSPVFPNRVDYIDSTFPASATWDITTNGIPDWHREITLAFDQISGSASAEATYQVYDGGTLKTTGYKYMSYYFNAGTPNVSDRNNVDNGFGFYGWSAAVNSMCGTMTFTRLQSNIYVVKGQTYNEGYKDYAIAMNGRQDSITTGITGIRLTQASGQWDSGRVRVFWR
tara:strand:+ start:9391 stop:9978 length:588 start_codon:yes stop_codon:yes gene_type:complete